MHADRRFISHFDWGTLILTLLLVSLSILLLYSTAASSRTYGLSSICLKQLSWLGLGLAVISITLWCDYQSLSRYAYVFYGLVVASLIAVLLFAPVINGAQRWLSFGPWRLQTSELVKPALILVLARYLSRDRKQPTMPLTLRDLFVPLALVSLPCGLIAKQPDLSTAMVLLAILCIMVIITGLQHKTMLCLGVLGLSALPAMWYTLKDYQRERLLALVNPQADLLGAGYHSWQSKIAIGSGGLWGKGLLAGTQSRLNFLPEKHTDFIFAVLAEELGFVGVCVALSLFALLLMHGLAIAYHSRDRLGTLIATGIVTMLAVQICLNIGMTIGLLPIIGIPLPLMSYGGSSLLTTCFCLGLLMNIRMHRFTF
jgi:rod shape determining protein RodA